VGHEGIPKRTLHDAQVSHCFGNRAWAPARAAYFDIGTDSGWVIELSGGSVAAGIGYSWGNGTLIFQGKRYALSVSGVSLASVGAVEYTAAGSVEGLKTPQDINGVFTAVGAGATLGGGGNIAAMRNQNGVVIHLTSTTQGLSLSLAASGMKIALAD